MARFIWDVTPKAPKPNPCGKCAWLPKGGFKPKRLAAAIARHATTCKGSAAGFDKAA